MSRLLISLAHLLTFIMVLGVTVTPASGETAKAKPEVWMGPPGYDNGRQFRELFDKPDEWKETRSMVDVLFYADHNLKRHFNDDELRKWFSRLNEWKLPFSLIYWSADYGHMKKLGLADEQMCPDKWGELPSSPAVSDVRAVGELGSSPHL